MELSNDDMKQMLYWMILGRKIEEKVTVLFRESRLRGHHHPGIGQEAANVGTTYGLKKKDCICLTHRGKIPELVKGMPLKDLVAGYFAKKEGIEGGRAPTGSHMYGDLSKGIIPGPGIIGSVIPLATGVGLALDRNGEGGVVVCFFGDGASNRGDFHEGINMAAAMKLPVIFCLVNNGYAMSVSVEKATGLSSLSVRAQSYGIPGVTVDGNDVRAVYEVSESAINRARSGEGPSLIECMVHRWTGHSISDADIYRTDEERKEGEKKDCILRFRNELIDEGVINEQDYQAVEKRVADEIEETIQYCENECVAPDPADICRGVYSDSCVLSKDFHL
jgi:TPP-dependent pyruvate/acetoin dehydrogenase alpha subunit